jgi:predicted CoA-substrate-specific enzyme activase
MRESDSVAPFAVGIDIGSISVAFVALDGQLKTVHRGYRFHQGNFIATLEEMFGRLSSAPPLHFGVTERAREFFNAGVEVNEQVALIAGVRHVAPAARSIITIGAETFGVIVLDQDGGYRKFISNSPCAAGTGSFLDQQALRLGLKDSAEISRLAADYCGDPPKIATRCAVFARTDLIHIQQQGYSLDAIAAGLCEGVAQNIHDTLFQGIDPLDPFVVVGGVSRNRAVVRALENLLSRPLLVPPDGECIGALGAALTAAEVPEETVGATNTPIRDLLRRSQTPRSYFYPPLSTIALEPPDFSSRLSFVHEGVETDLYEEIAPNGEEACYLGIDVGSTSTKSALVRPDGEVLAGFYTRTEGRPIAAVQKLTKAMRRLESECGTQFHLLGTGATGSGRRFIQRVTRTDIAIDEITAHARAAYQIDPAIDTIIEIGGQDAKFTIMENGHVTFAVMNHVCAAGTGSFIEEQAQQLGVRLVDFANLALESPAPLISDRCTVFMARDIHHLLGQGYRREELLAAALHSIRDNYLSKVAHPDKIGERIAFQGATAKNHALVRAFVQKLERPISVSKFCHLTGAFGVALRLIDAHATFPCRFRKDLDTEEVTINEYVCAYCKNHCKIKWTEIDGETVGWGYLCGRDETDDGFRKKEIGGFDLLRDHRRVFAVGESGAGEARPTSSLFHEFQTGGIRAVVSRPEFSLARLRNRIQFNLLDLRDELFASGVESRKTEIRNAAAPRRQRAGPSRQYAGPSRQCAGPSRPRAGPCIGLPATLTLFEYLPLWRLFFRRLGMHLIVSESTTQRAAEGKRLSGAEYCAPMLEFHGHIRSLADRADFIFFPQLIETGGGTEKNYYCYYSRFAVPLIRNIPGFSVNDKLFTPVLNMSEDPHDIARDLYLGFPDSLKANLSFPEVEEAYLLASEWFARRRADLQDLFRDQFGARRDVSIALLGRPYLVLNPALNKGIPDMLAARGIQSFFMDMIPVEESDLDVARDFLRWNHWHFGTILIRAAERVARTPGLYPIYVTAFRCSPDSFILSYFKRIMDYYRKPYLILEIDQHEAGEGYETRLEAAIESFRNHLPDEARGPRPNITLSTKLENKIYLLPGHDPLCAQLVKGVFINAGYEALVIEDVPETIGASLKLNEGQCLPVSLISLGIRQTIRKHNLDPARVAVYCNSDARISCNLPQFPVMIKQKLERMGEGLEKVSLLVGKYLPVDLPLAMMYEWYLATLLGGLVQKMTLKIRPSEKTIGRTDEVLRSASRQLFRCFASAGSKEAVFEKVVREFGAIERETRVLPQVGVVGDLYVRENDSLNRNLIREIERVGAEVATVPFIETIALTSHSYFMNERLDGRYLDLLQDKVTWGALQLLTQKLIQIARPVLGEHPLEEIREPGEYRSRYGLSDRHEGELPENILKIFHLIEHNPHLKLIVNLNPIFCCPGLISQALYRRLEKDIGIPIVSITYDGTPADHGGILAPYLHYLTTDAARTQLVAAQ